MDLPFVIGMDPGISGAIAVLRADGGLVEVADMPVNVVERKRPGGKVSRRSSIDPGRVGLILETYVGKASVVIEHSSARPDEGGTSAHSTGTGYGILIGATGALKFPFEIVHPATWKKRMRLGRDKGESRLMASRRWPGSSSLFARVKDDGRAEAALIALWAVETRREDVAAEMGF